MNIILTRKDLVYQDDDTPFEELKYMHFNTGKGILRKANIIVFVDGFKSKVFKFKTK